MGDGEGAAWDTTWSQEDFMVKDKVILLGVDDEIKGSANKYDSHRFIPGQPRGLLHRAFSVFLFNAEGKLLLQQRAASKITFPSVWTNTCCSHPLSGFNPTEVDMPADVASGQVPGIKRAAIRKLNHELGVSLELFTLDSFKFLTRLHYYAADALTHGPNSPWGEHEIDYILFCQVDTEPELKPHPDEVDDVRWVTLPELKEMMADPDLLWSPWFRIIQERFLVHWWENLKVTLGSDKYVDVKTIHRFEPPALYRTGAGVTGVLGEEGKGNSADKKQGAYGKIPTHSDGKLKQLMHMDEVVSALYYKQFCCSKSNLAAEGDDLLFCDNILGSVSRSFAAVIRQLPSPLCRDVLIFYLVLRALDTVEDDMAAFENNAAKIYILENFHKTILIGRSMDLQEKLAGLTGGSFRLVASGLEGVGEGDEAKLIQNFDKVSRVFAVLPASSQEVIADICEKMGKGMAEFASRDLGQGTVTVKEYDLYCHYVAGLVGMGLGRLFAASGQEGPAIAGEVELANKMGLFLQKTNIIRDYLEDFVDGRAFWPAEIWKKHTSTGLLGEMALPERRDQGLACLNEMVTNALQLAPSCLQYMEKIKHPDIFNFCAIPQVMAISTLAAVYANPLVFTGVVKIRKGLACKMILQSTDMKAVKEWFRFYAEDISRRVPASDPSSAQTKAACQEILAAMPPPPKGYGNMFAVLLVIALSVAGMFAAAEGYFYVSWGCSAGAMVCLWILLPETPSSGISPKDKDV
ncbi:unnamed protein product [Chrysoparadoxa australica]